MNTPYKLRHALSSLFAFCLLTGCASYRNDHVATPVDAGGKPTGSEKTAAGLIITGDENRRLASDYFGVLELTFENTTDQWVTVKGMALGFGWDHNKGVTIPTGEPLAAWAKASHQLALIRRHNQSVVIESLALAGAVTAGVGAATKNKGLAAAGLTVAAGSLTAKAASDVDDTVARLEAPYYEDHLLSVPFSIPPGLFAKRWVTVNTAKEESCVTAILLDYELEDGKHERAWLEFRSGRGPSDWQFKACRDRASHY